MISRREFLKLSSSFFLSQALPPLFARNGQGQSDKKNVLIIVFDALTSKDISFYGYPRDTMPNLSHLIERATVFHNHYANGNFTSPGTASLLTGTLPWTHRAIQVFDIVLENLVTNNIFNLFRQNGFHTVAYSHNPLVERQFVHFRADIDNHIPMRRLYLSEDLYSQLFIHDYDTAELSRHQVFDSVDFYNNTTRYTQTLFLYDIYWKIITNFNNRNAKPIGSLFPRGLPGILLDYFTLEDSVDYLIDQYDVFPTPFLGYFHFLPPHFPYRPRIEFVKLFNGDGYQMIEKPDHLFSKPQNSYKQSMRSRRFYNQFIAYVDEEFARFLNYMDERGLLEDTWLVITSDHGEMFERGIIRHSTECLHEPVIKIPLIIFEPGQTSRRDIFTPTSNIDILPTLLYLTGQSIPDWVEGKVLPPYNRLDANTEQSIFIIQAQHNGKLAPLTEASIAMVKGKYKLHAYFGYEKIPSNETLYELYDLEEDPEELENLISTRTQLARELQDELQAKLQEMNKPFIS